MDRDTNMFCFVIILVWLQFGYIFAQLGTECQHNGDCAVHQFCEVGYCYCNQGYIRNVDHCFKMRKFGQQCFFDLQCNDFRMLCKMTENDPLNSGLCICDAYHEWSEEFSSCIVARNATEMFKLLQETNTTLLDDVRTSDSHVFFWQAIAGMSAVLALLAITLINMTYGCCCRRSHTRLNEETDPKASREVAVIGHAEGTYAPIPTDFTVVV